MQASNLAKQGLLWARFILGLLSLFAIALVPKVQAQSSQEEFDSYRIRLEGFWVYSTPSGTFQGVADSGAVDLTRDLNFSDYSTFAGKLDWKFTHKNHFYVVAIPFNSTREVVLNRTVVFQGQTFQAGLAVRGNLDSPMYGFGYQYDIIRRTRGHLGLAVQFNAFNSHASISAAAQVTGNGVHQQAVSASGSLIVPLPVAGPEFRFYLTDSPRLYVEGNVYGMYFFGYGNYVSSYGLLGFSINRHLSLNAGYALSSRLVVNRDTSTNRMGINMTQKGPLVGVQFSF
jgi:hypothetical protein